MKQRFITQKFILKFLFVRELLELYEFESHFMCDFRRLRRF